MVDPEPEPGPHARSEATACLRRALDGDPEAQARLHELLHGELKRRAAALMRNERAGHTLQPTALVHEAWMRMFHTSQIDPQSQSQFLALASRVMRHVLVDHAKRRRSRPEGHASASAESDRGEFGNPASHPDRDWLLDLDEKLTRLADQKPRLARIVELHYFGGLTLTQVASVLGVSDPTVDRDWTFARAWLTVQLKGYSA